MRSSEVFDFGSPWHDGFNLLALNRFQIAKATSKPLDEGDVTKWQTFLHLRTQQGVSNFILAIVTIVYAAGCLTKEADQGNCSTSKSAEDVFKKAAEGEL